MAGYIYSNQSSLWGEPQPIGFGTDEFMVREIPRNDANKIIKTNHYSGTIVQGSFVHLGVFQNGENVGALQFGPAMNPASCSSVVTGTAQDEYLELNRMWLSDVAPRNSESRAVSYAIKFIRRTLPRVKWIQSFADERCGGFGIVYQACSFDFYGMHVNTFWELDGEWFHNKAMTTRDQTKVSPRERRLQQNKDRAIPHELRQFRYIKWLDGRVKKNCNLKQQPYPKHYNDNANGTQTQTN
jgi:hypothetical protein